MRRGEILSLTWENVHLVKKYVHLPDTKNGRDVLLTSGVGVAERPLGNIRSDQVVFPLHFEALKRSWRRACSRAGIIDSVLDLRHEAMSRDL